MTPRRAQPPLSPLEEAVLVALAVTGGLTVALIAVALGG